MNAGGGDSTGIASSFSAALPALGDGKSYRGRVARGSDCAEDLTK